MAELSISSSRDYIYETYALISISAKGFKLPEDTETTAYKVIDAELTIANYNWTTSDGYVKILGLTKGSKYTIVAKYVYSYKGINKEDGAETRYSISDSDTITIYTHPGAFSMGAVSGQTNPNNSNSIIKNVLTAEKINLWASHLQAAYRWYQQDNVTFSYFKNNKLIPLTVSQNDIITAEWFEACLAAMRAVGKTGSDYTQTITGGPTGTLITANRINLLNFSGKS